MDTKPKAGGVKKRAAKAAAKVAPQRERFIEAARAAGVDETGTGFESAIRKIVSAKPQGKVAR